MSQPCALTVGELRKLVTKARRDNHLTGPANKEQLIDLFEAHAEVHEDVAQVLEGEVRVPMLKVQRVMLKDMFHPKVGEMNRTALLKYVYYTASEYGWDYPDMDEYEQRTRIGKACRASRPIGKSAKVPAGILPKKDRPKRALSRHQRYISNQMKQPGMKSQYPDVKDRFRAVSAKWQANKAQVGRNDRALAARRRARDAEEEARQDAKEERLRRRRARERKEAKEQKEREKEMRDASQARGRRVRAAGSIPKRRNPARAASRR